MSHLAHCCDICESGQGYDSFNKLHSLSYAGTPNSWDKLIVLAKAARLAAAGTEHACNGPDITRLSCLQMLEAV